MISPPILQINVVNRFIGLSGSDTPSFPRLGATHKCGYYLHTLSVELLRARRPLSPELQEALDALKS